MKIGIVGLGLIGGSLSIDFRAVQHQVIGLSRSPETCDIAIERGIVDRASTHPSVLEGTHVVFLCPPIGLIPQVFGQIRSYLSPQTVVTDVGSVKGAIASQLHQQWPHFIGGHPMAGTADSGIHAAQSQLFQGNPYVLTPLTGTSSHAIDTLTALVQDLGAQLHIASPTEHDRAVSLISHLPILISSALISSCTTPENQGVINLAQALASSGFRDTSRVGGGNPELGRMVAQYNQSELLRSLDLYEQQLQHLRTLVNDQKWDALESYFAQTQQARPPFLNP